MSNSIKPGEVTTPKIATYAVTESKLASDSITTGKIKDAAVKTAKIGDKQVTGDKIAERSITTTKIVDNAITSSKIADGSVTRSKISNGVIGRPFTPPLEPAEIGDNAVTETKLRNNAVTTDKIKDDAVTTPKLAISSVTKAKLAPNSVGDSELIDGSVTTPKITPQSVNREKLNDDVISAFGHKFNFVSPWRILGPATYENAVPWEELPLATHLPEGTFAVILQLEISNPPYETGGRPSPELLSAVHIAMNPAPELRGWVNIRKDESQESGLSVGYQSGTSGTVNFAQGIVPVTDARTIEWELQGDFIPPPTKRVTVAIKLVGYIS